MAPELRFHNKVGVAVPGVEESDDGLSPSPNELTNAQGYCCFCWCFCCSCAFPVSQCFRRSTVRKKSFRRKRSDQITRTDVIQWSTSFKDLMEHKVGIRVFHEYLKSEHSEENILFWMAAEALKTETDPVVIKNKAQKIYDAFISTQSPKEVSIDSNTRSVIEEQLSSPLPNLYDHAQKLVYHIMYRDCFPRFITSNYFKSLLYKHGAVEK